MSDRKNAPQFEGDPVEKMLNQHGYVGLLSALKMAVLSGLIPVAVPTALAIWWPDLIGRVGLIAFIAFAWIVGFRYGAHLSDTAHDVDFRRKFAQWDAGRKKD